MYAVCNVTRLTGGRIEGITKDATRATARRAPRKRPSFLLLPYITHTLNIRTTVNMFRWISMDRWVAHTFHTCKANLPLNSAIKEYMSLISKKESGTYNIQVRGELTRTTHRSIAALKQVPDEVADEAQWAHISILRHEDFRTCSPEDLNVLQKRIETLQSSSDVSHATHI